MLTAAVSLAANAAPTLIRIGYSTHPGFIDKTDTGEYEGFGVEYLNEIAKYNNWEYQYVAGTRPELEEKLRNGEIDFMVPIMKTHSRDANVFDYPEHSMGIAASGLYVLQDNNNIYYDDFPAMQGMRVGGTVDSFQMLAAREYASQHGITFKEVYYKNYAQVVAALQKGEIDAMALSSLYRISGYRVVAITKYAPFYIVAKDHHDNALLNKLDVTIEQMIYEHPEFTGTLFNKYYGRNSGPTDPSLTREEMNYINSQPIINIGCYLDWYPLSYYNPDTQSEEGILIDIFRMIEKKSGLTFHFIPITENSSVGALKNAANHLHLFAAVVATRERLRDPELVLSHGFIGNKRAFVGLKNRVFDLHSHYNIAIPQEIRGSAAFLQENFPNMHVRTYPTINDCLHAVQNGEADAAFQNSYILSAALQHPEFENLSIWDVSNQMSGEFYLAGRSDNDPLLMSILNKYIDTLNPDDVQSIILKHTSQSTLPLTMADILHKYSLTIKLAAFLSVLIILLIAKGLYDNRRHITTLNDRNHQLSIAISQAQLASQAKSDFLSRMSHEIRTPMNAIIGLAEIARKYRRDPDRIDNSLMKIGFASNMLLNIINDILDMSAIENKKLKIASLPFQLKDVLLPIKEIYTQQCHDKGLHFEFVNEAADLPVLLGDSKRITQIFLNLLSNAVKFTPSGGNIRFAIEKKNEKAGQVYLQFTIADTGIGMSEEFQKRLFRPFEQASATTFQKFGGSGLGLSIAQNLISIMQGNISAQSELNKGTTFIVNLPFTISSQQTPETPVKERQFISEDKPFTGVHILLVEDNMLNQEVASDLLKMMGASVTTAENGKIAVKLFTAAAPGTFQLILMDIQMPVMNGYDACRAIRASGHGDAATIPIIAMTANAFTEDIAKAMAAGMNKHLAKPINTQEMFRVIQSFIK
jgi:signal transduction histidine kinase/CheY-like chemotaxis protein